jgi:HAD superfamily hydrolase (TIGR01458 family)
VVLSEGTPFGAGDGLELVDENADIVILGGAGPSFSHAALNRVVNELLDGAELVAMHRNRFWQTAGGLALDTGAYLPGLELVSGKRATVIGKPSQQFFRSVLAIKGMAPEVTAMVGDDIDNDVLAAQSMGLTGVLVRTGKFREQMLAQADEAPDHVVGSFADVPELLSI